MSYQQALQDIKLGYHEAAIAKLDPLLHADPSQPKLWYAKALALLSLQRFGDAITTVQLSIRLNPTWPPGYQLLGNACSQLGDKKEAIAAYKQAAHCYLDQGNKQQAQTCLEKLKALGPQFIPNNEQLLQESSQLLDKIALKQEQGSHEDALQDLNWLLHLDPHNVNALANRGLLQAKAQNYRAALADISLAIQLCPDDLNLQLQRGKIRLFLKDAQGAIADFSALLTTDWGDHAEIYCLRSQGYQQLNDLDTAFEDIANALYLDPHNQECYRVRGDIYRGMEEWEEALSNYRRSLSLCLEQGNWVSHQQVENTINPPGEKSPIEERKSRGCYAEPSAREPGQNFCDRLKTAVRYEPEL
ncbi:MAG: tetratricopeptide repeat protein [Crocosphaera sp.]|nr:tetratricopeptide repeat protein [Crocosphaera sp.]